MRLKNRCRPIAFQSLLFLFTLLISKIRISFHSNDWIWMSIYETNCWRVRKKHQIFHGIGIKDSSMFRGFIHQINASKHYLVSVILPIVYAKCPTKHLWIDIVFNLFSRKRNNNTTFELILLVLRIIYELYKQQIF